MPASQRRLRSPSAIGGAGLESAVGHGRGIRRRGSSPFGIFGEIVDGGPRRSSHPLIFKKMNFFEALQPSPARLFHRETDTERVVGRFRVLRQDRGATAIEYAIIGAMIGIGLVGSLLGTRAL